MHTIHTFILRIFIDSQAPERLRGSLQATGQKEAAPFLDGAGLLALLRALPQPPADGQAGLPSLAPDEKEN